MSDDIDSLIGLCQLTKKGVQRAVELLNKLDKLTKPEYAELSFLMRCYIEDGKTLGDVTNKLVDQYSGKDEDDVEFSYSSENGLKYTQIKKEKKDA